MAKIEIDGVVIAYETFGEGDQAVIISPGGRYSKDTPGVPALAAKVAEGGFKVLIWDRPNSGESDISFAADTESLLYTNMLAGLVRALRLGPVLLAGGSAGARVSLLTAVKYPDLVRGLFLFWISGGPIGMAVTAMHYCGEAGIAAAQGGMKNVAELPMFQELLERNLGNRQRLLSMDPQVFIAKMQSWAQAFFPQEGTPIPGLRPEDFAALSLPVMVLRSGSSDIHHPRATSEEVHRLISGATIADPPWGDNEWNERHLAKRKGEGLFTRWPLLAPQMIDFFKTIGER